MTTVTQADRVRLPLVREGAAACGGHRKQGGASRTNILWLRLLGDGWRAGWRIVDIERIAIAGMATAIVGPQIHVSADGQDSQVS